ncbi:MAG: sodium:proton antiporter [Gammaproteobacteria bacterium]|nr:sodium:proton antiporter [Gammaproteobacteria bacterium]
MKKTEPVNVVTGALILLLVVTIGIGLSWALWTLPDEAVGLSLIVRESMAQSGVTAEVTAILLNFRGYDTLLEIFVLLVALLGAWYLERMHLSPVDPEPGPVLEALVRVLLPFMIIISGYILWLGGHAAGGAFQAGALLAGAGVMLLVVGSDKLPLSDGIRMRSLLVAGPAVFTLVAGGLVLSGRNMLQYPVAHASSLILLIEAASTITIGITLTLLFAGGRPRRQDKS